MAGDELGHRGDVADVFGDRNTLLERVATADVTRREIHCRDAVQGYDSLTTVLSARQPIASVRWHALQSEVHLLHRRHFA
jgi:hypothetical protein